MHLIYVGLGFSTQEGADFHLWGSPFVFYINFVLLKFELN